MGLLRPLHAIDGAVEALGREAGSGLGFGFEGHVSGRVRTEGRSLGLGVVEA